MAELYINDLKEDLRYKRLLELNEIIKKKYGLLIVGLRTNEAYYNEAKEKGYPNNVINDLKKKYQESKINLQTKEEVIEYKKLESEINEKINTDFNDIKSSISNKFKLTNVIKF